MPRKISVLCLLLTLCLLCGCGSSVTQVPEPVATAIPTEEPTSTIRFTIPWDKPTDLEITYNSTEVLSAKFNGEDDVAPKDASIQLIRAEGDSATIEILWDNGETHTVNVENGGVQSVVASGQWKEDYDITWKRVVSKLEATYTATGIYESTYSKDAQLLIEHSAADYIRLDSGFNWNNSTTKYFDQDELTKEENINSSPDGNYKKDIKLYNNGALTEQYIEIIFNNYNEETGKYQWLRNFFIDKRETIGVDSPGKTLEMTVYLGDTDTESITEEMFAENAPIYEATFVLDDYSYDANGGTILERSYTEGNTDTLADHFSSLEAAEQASREFYTTKYYIATETADGWNWQDYDGSNMEINERILSDGCIPAAAKYGCMMAENGNPDAALDFLSKVYDADPAYGAGVIGDMYIQYDEPDKAIEWFTKAYEAGNINAGANAGFVMYALKNDNAAAIEWLTQVYDAHQDGNAAYHLGSIYYMFQNPKDFDMALEWFEKGYDAGDMNSLVTIINIFEDDLRDYEKLEQWLIRAYDDLNPQYCCDAFEKVYNALGHGESAFYLGKIYSEDFEDSAKAQEWFQRANDAGYEAAAQYLQ